MKASGPAEAWRPTKQQIAASVGAKVADVLGPGLSVLFVGINPGLYSGAVGHHFARPGNRFWKALHLAGFTDRVLSPFEESRLLGFGVGITNLVGRATAGADDVTSDELHRGARRLAHKVCRHAPAFVAFLGLGAYRTAFGKSAAEVGFQPETICRSKVWLLPNPSGLNAHYQIADLARAFTHLRKAAIPRG